ncbi:MAG TPA: alpha/beta hydrolase, partial [Agriterribacter sp.]|nr:alpha/beta hydrolase [Agriterribacter sp.]
MKLSHKIALTYLRARLQLLALVSPERAASKALVLFCTPRRRLQQNPSAIIKKATPLTLSINGLSICGYRWNHPSPKKILIAHGFESSARNFDGFVIPLIKKGYEIVAFDAPGHGKSDGSEITLPEYVRTLQAIVCEYGPFDAYIAHS